MAELEDVNLENAKREDVILEIASRENAELEPTPLQRGRWTADVSGSGNATAVRVSLRDLLVIVITDAGDRDPGSLRDRTSELLEEAYEAPDSGAGRRPIPATMQRAIRSLFEWAEEVGQEAPGASMWALLFLHSETAPVVAHIGGEEPRLETELGHLTPQSLLLRGNSGGVARVLCLLPGFVPSISMMWSTGSGTGGGAAVLAEWLLEPREVVEDPLPEAAPVADLEPAIKVEPPVDLAPAVEVEPAVELAPSVEFAPALGIETAAVIEPAVEIEPAAAIEPAVEIELALEIETAAEVEPVIEIEPAAEIEHSIEVEPAVEVETSVEFEPSAAIEPAVEPATSIELTPAAELEPAAEVAPSVELTPSFEFEPAAELEPPADTAPAADSAPPVELQPPVELAPAAEPEPPASALPPAAVTPGGSRNASRRRARKRSRQGSVPAADLTPAAERTPEPEIAPAADPALPADLAPAGDSQEAMETDPASIIEAILRDVDEVPDGRSTASPEIATREPETERTSLFPKREESNPGILWSRFGVEATSPVEADACDADLTPPADPAPADEPAHWADLTLVPPLDLEPSIVPAPPAERAADPVPSSDWAPSSDRAPRSDFEPARNLAHQAPEANEQSIVDAILNDVEESPGRPFDAGDVPDPKPGFPRLSLYKEGDEASPGLWSSFGVEAAPPFEEQHEQEPSVPVAFVATPGVPVSWEGGSNLPHTGRPARPLIVLNSGNSAAAAAAAEVVESPPEEKKKRPRPRIASLHIAQSPYSAPATPTPAAAEPKEHWWMDPKNRPAIVLVALAVIAVFVATRMASKSGAPAGAESQSVQRVVVPATGEGFSSVVTGDVSIRATYKKNDDVTKVKGAQVWVDGKLRASVPAVLELPRGLHSIRVNRGGFDSPVRIVEVKGGDLQVVNFEFGTGDDPPRLSLLSHEPPALLDRVCTITAYLDRLTEQDIQGMWVNLRQDGTWRAVPMTLLPTRGGVVGVAVLNADDLRPPHAAAYYLNATRQTTGEHYYTEIQNSGP